MRSIRDDLDTLDDEASERMDNLFADVARLHRHDAPDHARRIIGLADAEAIHNEELID